MSPKVTNLLATGPNSGDPFVGLTDTNKVRIGYRNVMSIDSGHPAFAAVAERAANLSLDELERAVEWALTAHASA